jgi:F-type H+-transporting ATPase subunit gamma
LLVIATAERGLCGSFNSSIVRLAREHAEKLLAQGKTVKIMTVGKKGNDALKRNYGKYIVDAVDFRGLKQLAFFNAAAGGCAKSSACSMKDSLMSAPCFLRNSNR